MALYRAGFCRVGIRAHRDAISHVSPAQEQPASVRIPEDPPSAFPFAGGGLVWRPAQFSIDPQHTAQRPCQRQQPHIPPGTPEALTKEPCPQQAHGKQQNAAHSPFQSAVPSAVQSAAPSGKESPGTPKQPCCKAQHAHRRHPQLPDETGDAQCAAAHEAHPLCRRDCKPEYP